MFLATKTLTREQDPERSDFLKPDNGFPCVLYEFDSGYVTAEPASTKWKIDSNIGTVIGYTFETPDFTELSLLRARPILVRFL